MSMPIRQYELIKLPYEATNAQFRRTRRQTERQMNQVLSSIITLKNNMAVSKDQALENLKSSREKLNGLKRHLTSEYLEQNALYETMKKRVNHMSVANIDEQGYVKTKIHRMIVEYFLLQRKFNQAQALSRLLKIEDYCRCQRQLLINLCNIIDSLKNHDLSLAKKWCFQNRTKLAKAESLLEFKLIMMQFFELIREKKLQEAIKFIRQQNITVNNNNREEFQKAMGCLSFSPFLDDFPKYSSFFSQNRWQEIIDVFKAACYAVYELRFKSSLETVLSMGISVIKTSVCNRTQKKPLCPICQTTFNKLSSNVPHTAKSLSTLICRVTKEKMSDVNPPMMLPNGQIFSKAAIDKLSKDGKVTCPITEKTFDKASIRKIFLF